MTIFTLTASSTVTQLIRCGVFNERDENGYPVKYPFTEYSKGVGDTAYDYTQYRIIRRLPSQAAQEAIVLLKNEDGILPWIRTRAL